MLKYIKTEGSDNMDNNKDTAPKKKKRYAKLHIIGVKQAVIYWILAILCVVGMVFYMRWGNKHYANKADSSSDTSSASVTYQLYI